MSRRQITINSLAVLLLDVPTIRPHQLSVATMRVQTLVLLRLRCSDGITGWGEATTIGGVAYGEESPESMRANIETYMAPMLAWADATSPATRMHDLRSHLQGKRFALCAIETALFDAQARQMDVPLFTLFGGRARDSLPVAWTLTSGDTARDIAEAEKMLDLQRHRIFKLKIGTRGVRADAAHVASIKR